MNKLENYKKEIGSRISILVLLCIVALLAVIIGNFYLKYKFPLKEDVTDYVVGFFTGLELVSVFYMGMLVRAYRNREILEKMYTKETDERVILIKMKSGANIIPIFSMVIVIVSLIVAYVSYEAFLALMIVAFVQIKFSIILKIYWSKKI
ncbi:hypothetical protein BW721_09060 [Jeotgalibaca sp. PTS2502]|jgi:hypothetical protein|uniref:hypothetical protein n=1 Tax=Jeotgalibaca sp. PTS2502 TaxID=1903686 RepID=UPI000973568F|nr:hypothetical protein [Jeotgalibaca sp. PTS2502]APZ49772.1 hypothetical protein BW721_09060 [Jeotgalibaca sp. PTS2502]